MSDSPKNSPHSPHKEENGREENGGAVRRSMSRSKSRTPASRSRSKSPEKRRRSPSPKSRSRTPVKRRDSRSRSRSRTPPRYRKRSRSPRSRSPAHRRRRSYSRSRSRSRSRSHGRRSSRKSTYRKRRSASPSQPSKVVVVFGLSPSTTEETLHKTFSEFGKLERVNLIKDKQSVVSKGFAFIYYATVEDAINAKEKSSGMQIEGALVRTDFSKTKRAHSPTPGRYMGHRRSRYAPYDRRESSRHSSSYY